MLTTEQKAQFESDGFLAIPGFASLSEVEELRTHAEELVDGFDPKEAISIFSTKDQSHKKDDYFFESASKVSFFFEEKAIEDGQILKPKAVAINKMGHAMHDIDPIFRKFSRSAKFAELARDLGFQKPIPVQSMYIFKQPGIGGEVVPHQDNSFLYTTPEPSVIGFWLAIQDANQDNGCLWGLPGSHKNGIARRFLKGPDGQMVFDRDAQLYDLEDFVPIEAKAGTLVVLHGSNVHYSKENTSPVSRHAYTVHMVEGEGREWAKENWLQRREDLPLEPLVAPVG